MARRDWCSWFLLHIGLPVLSEQEELWAETKGSHSAFSTSIGLQFHRLALIMNIPALLLLADWCLQRGIHHQLFPNAAFIVFAVHYPIVVALRKLCAAKFASASDVTHIFLYYACIIIATALSLFFYILLEKYFPKLKNILSGNR